MTNTEGLLSFFFFGGLEFELRSKSLSKESREGWREREYDNGLIG
jgi:hypothetical protein